MIVLHLKQGGFIQNGVHWLDCDGLSLTGSQCVGVVLESRKREGVLNTWITAATQRKPRLGNWVYIPVVML